MSAGHKPTFNIGDKVSWKGPRSGPYFGTIEETRDTQGAYFIRRDNGNCLTLPAEDLTLVEAAPTKDTLAAAIVKISDGVTALLKSGLNRKAIVVLLKDSTGITQRDIGKVLDGLATLKKEYAS